ACPRSSSPRGSPCPSAAAAAPATPRTPQASCATSATGEDSSRPRPGRRPGGRPGTAAPRPGTGRGWAGSADGGGGDLLPETTGSPPAGRPGGTPTRDP